MSYFSNEEAVFEDHYPMMPQQKQTGWIPLALALSSLELSYLKGDIDYVLYLEGMEREHKRKRNLVFSCHHDPGFDLYPCSIFRAFL